MALCSMQHVLHCSACGEQCAVCNVQIVQCAAFSVQCSERAVACGKAGGAIDCQEGSAMENNP